MHRSQCAFACDVRTGVFSTRSDIDRTRFVDGGREDPIVIVHEHAIARRQEGGRPETVESSIQLRDVR